MEIDRFWSICTYRVVCTHRTETLDLVRISVHEGSARREFLMGSVRLVASLVVGYSEATSTGILSLFLIDAGLSVLA